MAVIATVSGTAIRPGISRNNRLYKPEVIEKAVRRAQERIAQGDMPLTTLTHHEAGDDSSRIVGQITSITLEDDGSARYTADITNTSHGRDILNLVSGPKPALKGVSIRGAWLGKVRRETGPDGQMVETGDDLELDGLDYTRKPGVPGAQIDAVTLAGAAPRESDGSQRVLIAESAPEATVTIAEAATPADGPFADPGYQADKKKRYPLDTKSRAKSAWSYIHQADNARLYTSAQLKRVKQRIVKALKGYGVQVAAQEGWLIDPATAVSESLAECWDMPSPAGNLYISLTNGPTTVTVSSALLDPHDLDLVGRAAMAGACQALLALDPDMDADIDIPGADGEDTDRDMGAAETVRPVPAHATTEALTAAGDRPGQVITQELADAAPAAAETTPATETSAPAPAAEPATEEEPAMAESITPAADTAASPAVGGITLTDDQFAQLLARVAPAAAPVEAAPAAAAPVAEAAAPAPVEVAETDDQRIARLVAEGIKAALPAAIQESVERTGPPARKGLVAQVTETSQGAVSPAGIPAEWPQKPLHEYTDEEFRQHVSPATVGVILGARAQA